MKDTAIQPLDQDIVAYIKECNKKEFSKSYLIAALHRVQSRYGYLSEQHMDEVAQLLQVPTATVSGVATFYHFFKLKPRGKYAISVCLGTACFVKGADRVLDAFKKELGVEYGDVTHDGLFSLENSRCVGVCAMAPVVMVNDKVFSNVQEEDVLKIISTYRNQQ